MNNPKYQKVLTNKRKIAEALKLIPGATSSLITEFQQKSWLPLTENPTEEKLVDAVLGRIVLDPDDFERFIVMLKAVPGSDQIVKILEGSDGASTHSVVGATTQPSHGMVGLTTIVSKKQLDKIARELLIKWEEISSSLELTQQQEQDIRENYKGYGDQKREVLYTWKHNKGNGATFGALIAAAEDVSNMQLAHGIRDLMKTLPAGQ